MENTIQKWEYKLVNVNEDGGMKANYLGQILPKTSTYGESMSESDWNILGNLGWEVVASYGYDSRHVLLKRPKFN